MCKCNSQVLVHRSNFFAEKFKNTHAIEEVKLDYTDFSHDCLNVFLDIMYGVNVESIKVMVYFDLIKFLQYEGKSS